MTRQLDELNEARRSRFPVLIVDDDRSMRDTLSICLHEEGFTVCSLANAEAAIRLLENSPQQWIVISDRRLGNGMTGVELGRVMASRYPDHGFLLMSGESDGETCLAKPFALVQLLARLDTAGVMMVARRNGSLAAASV